MQITPREDGVAVTGVSDFDPVRIFECGQCFRWNADGRGVYTGVVKGRVLRVRREGDAVLLGCSAEEFNDVWRAYFDLDLDYAAVRRRVSVGVHMRAAAAFGAGIRILRQDRWEALCSFIISQCNNIPRIKKIVEALCRAFGEPIPYEGDIYYSFPDAGVLARLAPSDLAVLRCGYRAAYIQDAARSVASGELDLEALGAGGEKQALAALKKINGVGDKVAGCAVLFGLHMLDAFPVDTWIKRTLREHYGAGFDPSVFSPYAGVAQQYMFYYARNFSKTDVRLSLRESSR